MRISHILRRAAMALALVAGFVVAVSVGASPAYAIDHSRGTAGYCPDDDGVTVIIDFQDLGGTSIVRCAPGAQATGLDALKNAGIEITGTNRWGEAFICRIEGKPGSDTEPCIDTPPATAYWSYWHASNGGDWEYSQWGVMNRQPPPGSFEGWSFSQDNTGSTNPPPRLDPERPVDDDEPAQEDDDATDTEPGSSNPTSDQAEEPVTDDGSPTGADAESPAGEDEDESVPSDPGGDDPARDRLPSEAPGWTGVGEDGMQPVARTETGMPTGTIAGIAAVGLVAVAATATAWRRRNPDADDTA